MTRVPSGERIGVLLAAHGAAWEVEALRAMSVPGSPAVPVRRCMDLADLLASAATGQASAAVLDEQLPGLDADAVRRLEQHDVVVVVVTGSDVSVGAPALAGVAVVPRDEVTGLPGTLRDLADAPAVDPAVDPAADRAVDPAADRAGDPAADRVAGAVADGDGDDSASPHGRTGRLLAVWGPAGAPGRTTVALSVAAELARRGCPTLLVDADCHGGAVAQQLGILDEASGLLAAVRAANAGRLDTRVLARAARSVGQHLRVLTGLPRPDRWVELRPAGFADVLATARSLVDVVVLDLGFDLEEQAAPYASGAPPRNQTTLDALAEADEVVVVGSAEPVGLSRLARGLVELPDVVPSARTRVVVNRTRPSLGWSDHEVRAMVEGFVGPVGTHFLPYDREAADTAAVSGRAVPDAAPGSRLADAVAGLVDGLVDGPVSGPATPGETGGGRPGTRRAGRRPLLRRRRAGTTR